MNDEESPKRYDLEERTFLFAKRTRDFVTKLPRTVCNMEDAKQLLNEARELTSIFGSILRKCE